MRTRNTFYLILILFFSCDLEPFQDLPGGGTCNLTGTPEAKITANITTCNVSDCTITFDASQSSNACNYKWDLDGNVSTIENEGVSIQHNFTQIGEYLVTLVIENDNGEMDSGTINISVVDNISSIVTFEIFENISNLFGEEQVKDHIIDSDGNYVVCGANQSGPFVYKVSRTGAVQWDKNFFISSDFLPFNSLIEIPNDNEYLLGGALGWDTNPAARINKQGSLITNSLTEVSGSYVDNLKAINDGSNLFVYSTSFPWLCIPFCPDVIRVIDKNGNDFSPTNLGDDVSFINDVEVNNENKILISGLNYQISTFSYASFDSTILSFSLLDENYQNSFVTTSYNIDDNLSKREVVVDATFDQDGNIYLLAYMPEGQKNIALLKLDSNGNFLWSDVYKTYGMGGFENDIPVSLDITIDNNVIITGHTRSFSSANGNYKIFLLKVDPEGNIFWNNTQGFKLFGNNTKNNIAVKVTTDPIDGGFVVSGLRDIDGNILNSTGEFYLLKTNQEGEF